MCSNEHLPRWHCYPVSIHSIRSPFHLGLLRNCPPLHAHSVVSNRFSSLQVHPCYKCSCPKTYRPSKNMVKDITQARVASAGVYSPRLPRCKQNAAGAYSTAMQHSKNLKIRNGCLLAMSHAVVQLGLLPPCTHHTHAYVWATRSRVAHS